MTRIRSTAAWRTAMRALRPLRSFLPRAIWSHLWFTGEFTACVHNSRFRIFHGGSEIENELFWRDTFEHERGTVKVAAELLPAMSAFLDVGANSGVYSLLAKGIDRRIKVVAVEPSAANLELLRRNVALNRFDIVIEDAAATSADGEIILHDFPQTLIPRVSKQAGETAPSSGSSARLRSTPSPLPTVCRANGC